VFYRDVAYVVVAIHIYCKCVFQMFYLFQTYVASVLSGCLIYSRLPMKCWTGSKYEVTLDRGELERIFDNFLVLKSSFIKLLDDIIFFLFIKMLK
jgi:hypothetical protein